MSTKTIQGQLWSIAPSYWADHFEPWFLPMYRDVIDQLHLSEADVLLDAGCGAGLFSRLAIKAGAQVTGVDAAPGLLELARKRNPDNNFLEEDLEALPFRADSFDVVTCFNSLQYAGSFQRALEESARVLKPGGRLVIGIWDRPEKSDATQVLKAIGSLLPPPPPGTPGPFALSEDGRIEEACAQAGLRVDYRNSVPCPFAYRSLEEGVRSFMGTGPAAIALAKHARNVVEDVIGDAISRFETDGGLHFLQKRFLVFIASK